MPPARSEKRRAQLALGNRIESTGEEMVACSKCEKSQRRCIAVRAGGNSNRCSECCRNGKTCDVVERNKMPSASDWDSLDRQRRKLRDEKDEAMAKIIRLNKQERLLDERENKMIAAGLNSMDELDALEQLEKDEQDAREEAEQEAGRAQRELAATSVPGPSDWLGESSSVFDPSLCQLSDQEWQAILGTGGGTPQASQGG